MKVKIGFRRTVNRCDFSLVKLYNKQKVFHNNTYINKFQYAYTKNKLPTYRITYIKKDVLVQNIQVCTTNTGKLHVVYRYK